MDSCKEKKVNWAIFSDQYGVWFPNVKHQWYEKSPDEVTDVEYVELLRGFDERLAEFDEIWFYYNPTRIHKLYRRLLDETSLRTRLRRFTHIAEITKG
jgi:hypothetical protein